MAKYLDSKGLSYLWQKIRNTYVNKDTVIKLGTDDSTGISLEKATAAGQKDSWRLPFATIGTTTKEGGLVENFVQSGIVRSGATDFMVPEYGKPTDWNKAAIVDGYVWYKNTEPHKDTVTAANGDNLTSGKVVLGAGDKTVKTSVYSIGKETYANDGAVFGGTSILATEAGVVEYVDTVAGGITSGLELTYTEGEGDYTGKKVIKLTDTNNKSLKVQLDATPFIKDGMLDSVEILKMHVTEGREGADDLKQWKTIDGTTVQPEDLINAPWSSASDGSIWMYFVWKTVSHNPNNVEGEFPPKTATWLPATDLINDCSADSKRGLGTDKNADGSRQYYVKTTENGPLANANVTTGFNASGEVVGYVDLSDYQKTSDLAAFTEDELNAIFESADALYEAELNGTTPKTKYTPAYPEVDPLAGQGTQVPEFPSAQV